MDSLEIVIRSLDPDDEDGGYAEVLVTELYGADADVDLGEVSTEVDRWLASNARDGRGYSIETRRTATMVGAESLVGAFLVTFISATGGQVAGQALYDGLADFIRSRVGFRQADADLAARYAGLEPGEVADRLRRQLSGTLDRRPSDFEVVKLVVEDGKVKAKFETRDGEVYRVRVDTDGFRVTKIRDD